MSPLETDVTKLPESRVRIAVEVPADDVERRVQRAAKQLGRELRIPGFRKGKVPPTVVIGRLGRGAVLDDAIRGALGDWYVEALEGAGIAPVGDPDLNVGDPPAPGQPLTFSIEIGVRPEARLGTYKGLEVGRREPEVSEEAIDAEIEQMRDRIASLETVERSAQAGDHLVMDYVGSVDGMPFEGGEGRDQLIELGSGRLIPGFEDQLIGACAGDTREVTVTFPEGYPNDLGEKDATFQVTVTEVKAKRLPELGDEFASESGGFDSLQELREDIAGRLRKADEAAIEREFEEAVLQAAADEATVELPDQLVHARAHEVVHQTMNALTRQGISKETYLRIAGKDEESLAHDAEPDAATALRREAVLAAVILAEKIEPSAEDLVEALRPAAERDGSDPAELVTQLREAGRLDALREDVAARQAIELLVREASPITLDPAGTAGAADGSRGKLWTPGSEDAEGRAEQIWTPGS